MNRGTLGIIGLLLVFLGGGAIDATAQTPAATIENGGGGLVLESYWDGGMYVPGEFGPTTPADSIPATGGGTRLMWYPAKAAFRAGQVGGTQWDAANVGDYSVALGVNTTASGGSATALGDGTTASGTIATALGASTTASGINSTAMGSNTTADAVAATAMGSNTTASGQAATAMGLNTTAGGASATATGRGTTADNTSLLTAGECNSTSTSGLFVVGNGTYDTGTNSCSGNADALVLDDNGNLSVDGVFTPGPTGSTYAGHLQRSQDGDGSNITDHAALVENTSAGSSIGSNVLALRVGSGAPDATDNFITFFDSNDNAVGTIEGSGGSDVTITTGSADFAEELPVAEDAAVPEATDLVGVSDRRVSLQTERVERLMVVSQSPAVIGNTTPATTADDDRRVPVAFIGQVPVRVRGEAEVGDLIVASGHNDGTARAVAPANYRRAEHGPIAGEAWAAKTTEGVGTVTVAVGLDHSGAVAEQLQTQRTRIDSLEQEVQQLDRIEKRLARLEAQDRSVSAGIPMTDLLLGVLVGGLLGAGLVWRRRH